MGFNLEALRSEQARLNNQNSWQDKYVRLPDGDCSLTVRILPACQGQDFPWKAVRMHKIGSRNYYSPMTLVKGKWTGNDPMYTEYRRIWAEIEKLERQGKMDAARELRSMATAIRPIERFYYNVIVRKEINKDTGEALIDVGPKIWSCGKELQARIVNAMLGNQAMEDPGLGDVTDFMSGRDFRIRKTMRKGKDISYPEYSQSSFLNQSAAGTQEQWKKWTETLWNLEDEIKIRPMEELQDAVDIFMGRKEDPQLSVTHPSASPAPQARTLEVQKPTVQRVVTNVPEGAEADVDVDDDFIQELRNL